MRKFLSFLMLFVLCFSVTIALAEIPESYVSVYSLKPEADITPLTIGAKASYQLAGPANGWGDLADYDFSNYGKLVINLTFDPADAGKMFAVRFNVNSVPGGAKVKLEKFTLPASGTTFSAEIDLEKYAEDGKVGVGGIVFYNGATHWSFNYDEGTPTSLPVTINYVALAPKVDLTKIPADFVSIYTLKPEAEITPLAVGAVASYQLAGPGNGWGDLADYDFSKYRKLVINLTFDPADAGKMFAVRFNVNSTPGNALVKLEKFTLPATGTNFSAVIELEKYADEGKVGVGGIVFYNGASHWSFNYDEGTPTAKAVTINYVALADEIIDPTVIPKDYVSFYTIKSEAEITPLEVGAIASYQLAGPGNGWGDLADYDLSKYKKLVINLNFDSADAGKMIAVRFNVNSTPGNALVKLEKFTLPAEGTNFSAVIDLEKYAEEGKVGVGGIIFYNGAAHWSFNYDDGIPTSLPVTINYVAVGPVEEVPVNPTTELVIENIIVGTVDSPDDFTGKLSISWDLESVYMVFDITDDSIVSSGTAYQVDNIEVYFDMDNSKNVKWPRNGGWMSNDPTFDDNDFQFRLVPGVDFNVNNSFEGAVQEYEVTEKGYMFKLTIPWDSLMLGFVPAIGTQIGFDVLVSDNDAVASDANRNQITLVSKTDKPFNDPSLFGTLEFLAEGMFKLLYDTTAPEKPAVTATVDETTVTLSWPLATDNIAVMSYDVKQDGVLIKEKFYALEAGNKLVIKDLADGTYKFTVICYDNSGNSSQSVVEAIVKKTSVSEHMAGFKAFPNPSNGQVNIVSGSNTTSVLDVFNMRGERIMRKSFINNCSIDLSNISKGIYILNVMTDNKVNITKLDIR